MPVTLRSTQPARAPTPASLRRPSLAIVLAAGASRRMGTPKALLDVDGVPLIVRHVRAYQALGLPVCVVLGAHADAIRAVLEDVRFVENEAWASTGPAESAALALQGAGTCFLAPVDTPPPWPSTLEALLPGDDDAVPTWEGLPGHPVRLAPPHPPGRLDHRLARARRVPVEQPDVCLNLNTPTEWSRWRASGGGRAPPGSRG